MAKELVKQNGKWIDRANGNAEYTGHVVKDLEVGDMYEIDVDGVKKKMKMKKKEVSAEGFLIVTSSEV